MCECCCLYVRTLGLRLAARLQQIGTSALGAHFLANTRAQSRHWACAENGFSVVAHHAKSQYVRGARRQCLCRSRCAALFFVLQVRTWKQIQTKPLHLLCDARCVSACACHGARLLCVLVCFRSTPPRVGAVLLAADGKMSYTDCAPPASILEQFHTRNDNQIASLEMLAIAYGERCAPGCV